MRSPRQKPSRGAGSPDGDEIDPITDFPEPDDEADEDSDLDDFDLPCTDADDARWDVFIPDDDERDPLPEPSDFGGSMVPPRGYPARSMEPD